MSSWIRTQHSYKGEEMGVAATTAQLIVNPISLTSTQNSGPLAPILPNVDIITHAALSEMIPQDIERL